MPNVFRKGGMSRPKDPLYLGIKDGKRGDMNFIRGRAYHAGQNTLAKTKKGFPTVKGHANMKSVQSFPMDKKYLSKRLFGHKKSTLSRHS